MNTLRISYPSVATAPNGTPFTARTVANILAEAGVPGGVSECIQVSEAGHTRSGIVVTFPTGTPHSWCRLFGPAPPSFSDTNCGDIMHTRYHPPDSEWRHRIMKRYKGRRVYTITESDVGLRFVRIGASLREIPLGMVLHRDVGKQIWEHDGVLQVESDEQFHHRRSGIDTE